MVKYLISGPILPQIWTPKCFSWILPLLDVRHCCKLSSCAISRENYKANLRKWQKKLSFGPNFGPFDLNLGPNFFSLLDIVASYHCMQFQGKLMKQTWENCKKPSFKPDFGPFGPNLGPNFIYLFFSKIWLRQSLDIIVSYHHAQHQKKLMIQSWENVVTDGHTDGQTDERASKMEKENQPPNYDKNQDEKKTYRGLSKEDSVEKKKRKISHQSAIFSNKPKDIRAHKLRA